MRPSATPSCATGPRLRLPDVDRARRDQHGDGRRIGHDQPRPGAPDGGRRLRRARPEPGPPAARVAAQPGHQRQRHLPPGRALLGPHQPPRAGHHRHARGHARPDLARRDRRRVPRPAAGHPDLRLRLPGPDVRQARLGDPAQPPRSCVARDRGRLDPRGEAAGDLRRRWRPLFRGRRRPARLCRADRDPGRRDPRRQGIDALRPPLEPRWRRRVRHARGQCHRARGGPRDRHRDALHGLPDRVQDRVPGPGRPVRQHQRRGVRRLQARRGAARRRRSRDARGAGRRGRGLLDGRRVPRARRRAQPRVGRGGHPRPSTPTAWARS